MAFSNGKKLHKNTLSSYLAYFFFFSANSFVWIFKTRDVRKSLDSVSVNNNPTLEEKWNILITGGPSDLCLLRLYGNNIF